MMRKSFLLIPIVLIIFNHTFAQSRQNKQLDSLFSTLFKQKEFNGNVLIAEKGKILFEESYGFANEKNGQKLNNHTIFELASVSKQFTAMGIVLLEKKGKLNYGDTMSKYIPELGFYDNISIRNLLNHTSGLPDYMQIFEEKWDKAKIAVLGWFVVNSKKYGRIVYHTGGWPGYSTYIERHLDSDKTIVILQNHSEAKINSFLQKVRAILYEQ